MNDHAARKPAILRTALALLSVQGLTWLSSLVSVLVVPRYLGAARFGQFSVAVTITRVVMLVAGSGTTSVVVRDSARNHEESANLVGHAITGRIVVWVVLAACLALAAPLFSSEPQFRLILPIFLLGAGIGLVAEAAVAGLQGNYALGRVAISGGVIGVAGQVIIVMLLISGGGVMQVAMVGLGVALLTTTVALVLFVLRCGLPTRWSLREARALMAAGRPFLAWDLAILIYGSIDFLLLAVLTNDSTVGIYSLAYRLAGIPAFIPTIVMSSLFAPLAAAAKDDLKWFANALFRGAYVVLLGTTPMALGIMLLSPQIVNLIGQDGEFSRAVPCLVIIAFHIPFIAVDTIFGMSMYALDRQGLMARFGWFLAGFNPLMNLAAIPLAVMFWNNGAIGASIISVVTELITFGFMLRQVGPMLADQPWRSAIARLGTASALMSAATVLGLLVGGLPVAVVLGACVYGISVIGLRLITPADLAQVRDAIQSRNAPLPQEP